MQASLFQAGLEYIPTRREQRVQARQDHEQHAHQHWMALKRAVPVDLCARIAALRAQGKLAPESDCRCWASYDNDSWNSITIGGEQLTILYTFYPNQTDQAGS